MKRSPSNGSTSYLTKTVSLMMLAILAASAFTTIIIPKAAFAVTDPSAKMNLWSPHSDTDNDGTPASTFTFSADATASAGLQRLEWDFDGDGNVDATTPISGAPNHVNAVTTTRVYGAESVFWPQVRSVDTANAVSDWSKYSVGGSNVPLDVFWPPPVITMLAWQPFTPDLNLPVTFSATAFNEVGVQLFLWDLDGDGEADASSPANPPGAQNASSSISHTYTGPIGAFPAVRVLDSDGFLSAWDVYDINGQPVKIVIGSLPPTATMNQWSPYSATGADGLPDTLFTFSVSGSSDDGIARVEWDFDGDGNVDATTPVSGSPTSVDRITTAHVYNAASMWIPQARVVDVNNLTSAWASFVAAGSPAALNTAAPAMSPVLTFSPRAPSDVGSDGDVSTLFTFTTTYGNNPVSFRWDFDGDGTVDATTSVPTATHTYSVAGSYVPTVKVVDVWGTTELAYPLGSSGQQASVDVSPLAPTATMSQWSPYSASGPDGDENTVFTLSANATASGGIASLEWDFDGDGTVDATTPVSGAPQSVTAVTTTHAYGADGSYTPKVRAVGMASQYSGWDAYNIGSSTPAIDVSTPAPVATMGQWSPFASTGPDGYTGATFTFSAGATSAVGIDRLEWDFDGDGTVDAVSEFNGETSVSGAATTYAYGAVGSYTPQVRAVDTDGKASAWDAYDSGSEAPTLDVAAPSANNAPAANAGPDQTVILGSTAALDGSGSSDSDSSGALTYVWSQRSGPISVTLDTSDPARPTFIATPAGTYVFELKVRDSDGGESAPDTITVTVASPAAPVAAMSQWSPYSATGADGTPDTVFTFSANATASVGVARLEWDFDGDGNVDATSAVAGAPASVSGMTKTFTYGASGTYTPQVRVVDSAGSTSAWSAYVVGATTISLDVSSATTDGGLYCGGNTIDQLIASHRYNVIDKRASNAVNIAGTGGNDLILGNDLGDTINGNGGNDCIIAGSGNDNLYDYKGDTHTGETDWVYGGGGNDYLQGNYGDDMLFGGSGDDVIEDVNGNDSIDGGPGNDKCVDTAGNNTVTNCEQVAPPSATMKLWSPYSAFGPDGTPTTAFTFSASATSQAGVQKFEWDFDGNGSVDATTNVTGSQSSATATTTHAYGSAGSWTPQVRAVDANGDASPWDAYTSRYSTVKLDVSGSSSPPPSSGELYCGGNTIDQLIASGQYNVIDNRDGQRKTLNGTDGKDLILAGKYGDVINGKKGDDCIIGGEGDDILHGQQGDDMIYGNGGNDKVFGDGGNDKLYGGSGHNDINGGTGNDAIYNDDDDDSDHNSGRGDGNNNSHDDRDHDGRDNDDGHNGRGDGNDYDNHDNSRDHGDDNNTDDHNQGDNNGHDDHDDQRGNDDHDNGNRGNHDNDNNHGDDDNNRSDNGRGRNDRGN